MDIYKRYYAEDQEGLMSRSNTTFGFPIAHLFIFESSHGATVLIAR
jgi:hypothetical protein